MWKAFRGSGNGVKRLFELVEQSGDLPVVSWSFHLWIGVAVATVAAVFELLWRQQLSLWWWLPLKFVFVDGPSCCAGQESDNGGCDVFPVKRWLDSRYCWSYVSFSEPAMWCCVVHMRILFCFVCQFYFYWNVNICSLKKTIVSVSLGPPTRYII